MNMAGLAVACFVSCLGLIIWPTRADSHFEKYRGLLLLVLLGMSIFSGLLAGAMILFSGA